MKILINFLAAAALVTLLLGSNGRGQDKPPPTLSPPAPSNDYYPASWKEFVSTAAGFSVKLPRTPQERQIVRESDGEAIGRKYRLGSENFIVYTIEAVDLGSSEKFEQDQKKVFLSMRDERAKNFESPVSVVSELSAMRNGYPSFYAEFNAGKDLRYRELYVFGDGVFYLVSIRTFRGHKEFVMGSKDDYGEIAKAFIQSFKVLGDDETKKLTSTPLAGNSGGKFRDEEYRFSVNIPGELEILESKTDSEAVDVTFESVVDDTVYTVVAKKISDIFSFSDGIREMFYDNWRNGYLKGVEGKLESEKSFEYKGIKGRDLVVSSPKVKAPLFCRILAMNGKFYSLKTLHVKENLSPELRAKFESDTQKFFNSFEKLFEFEPPKYYGIVFDDVYTSEYYRIVINLPKKWNVVGGQVMVSFGDDREDVGFDVDAPQKLEPELLRISRPGSTTGEPAFILMDAKFFGSADLPMKQVALSAEKQIIEKRPGLAVAEQFAPFKVNGVEIWKGIFKFTDADNAGKFVVSYYIKEGNYLFTINGGYKLAEDGKLIDDAVRSIRFLPKL
ncbi:MAG: hypothetical protein KIS76_09310 [Pyrinomonadaceae bacterium]|nr:hypothetical protein [Pyrinomonadaceae bacterium]